MFSSSRRSRRHRNPQGPEKNEQPFFTKAGKGTVQTKKDTSFFQAKGDGMAIGQPGDKYEKEADSVATAVANRTSNTPAVQQKKEGGLIQRITLSTPKEDEKLSSTTEDRMKRDKYIQEKAETGQEEEPISPMLQRAEEEGEIREKPMQEEEKPRMMEDDEEQQPGLMEKHQPEEQEKEKTRMQPEEDTPEVMEMGEAEGKEEEEGGGASGAVRAKHQSGGQKGRVAGKELTRKIGERKGKGRPLPEKARAEMEKAMGVNLGQVTIHTDASAVEMNKALGAQAFTHGKDIFFNTGKYNPENSAGKQLLAHELTHVVQQTSSPPKAGAGSRKPPVSSASPSVQMNGGGGKQGKAPKSKRATPEHLYDRDAAYILRWIGMNLGGTLGKASDAEITKAAEAWIRGNEAGTVEISPGKWKWCSDDKSEERIFFPPSAKGDGFVQANFIKYVKGKMLFNAHVTKAN